MFRFLTIVSLAMIQMTTSGQNHQPSLQYEDVYSVYITKDLSASKTFYVQTLQFDVVFESSWFIYLQSKGDHKLSLAFMDINHPSAPPSYGAFPGSGSFLTLQVKDATQVYRMLKELKAPISYELTKEDWGQLRFGLTDPNGMYIDIVQQVEHKPGYWEKYLPKD